MNIKCLSLTPHDVGQPMTDTKVIQKLTQNLKIMLWAIRLLWAADNVSQVVCVHIIHDRAIIFYTNNHIILVVNNINKILLT